MFEHVFPLLQPTEREQAEHILNIFYSPNAERSELNNAARHPFIFSLEKRYVPKLNEERARKIGCETLISTVGLRESPVILTVLCLRPKKLFLLHTEASRPNAETVRDDPDVQSLGLRPNIDIVLKSISEVNAPENYDILQSEILPRAQGQIVVDPTGGLKIMGISLAAMAFWRRLPMVYLQGEEFKGIVIPFSEVLSWVKNPYDHFGDRDLELVQVLFNRRNYSAARNVCSQLIETVGDQATLTRITLLKDLIELYMDWDAFRHSPYQDQSSRKLGTRLNEITRRLERLECWLIPKIELERNIEFLTKIEKNWEQGKNIVDPYRLVDIFLNAERKAEAGQYDDAVARLYRCLEMCSTYILTERWGVESTSRPNIEKISETLGNKDKFAKQFRESFDRDLPLNGSPWGLDDQMKVLYLLEPNNSAVKAYIEMSKKEQLGEEDLMNKRNRSILAHGTNPVEEKDYNAFRNRVEFIARTTLGNNLFKDLCAQGKHPNLSIT